MDDFPQHGLRSSSREPARQLPDFVNQGSLGYGGSEPSPGFYMPPHSEVASAFEAIRGSGLAQFPAGPNSSSPDPYMPPFPQPLQNSPLLDNTARPSSAPWPNDETNQLVYAYQGEWSSVGLDVFPYDHLELADAGSPSSEHSTGTASQYNYEQAVFNAIPTTFGTSGHLQTVVGFAARGGGGVGGVGPPPTAPSQYSGWGQDERGSTSTGFTQRSSAAPSTNVSTPLTVPEATSPARYHCDECKANFSASRDLRRHKETKKHRKALEQGPSNSTAALESLDDSTYKCRCGFRQNRKDLYKRHQDKCQLKRNRYDSFTCRCGEHHTHKPAHLNHVSGCRRGRPGRPKNNIDSARQ